MQNKRAQSTLEISILIIIIVAALLAMTAYLKRSIQGRLRSTADNIGEQYSPGRMRANITITTDSNTTSDSSVRDEGIVNAYYNSTSNITETTTRQGYEETQGYANEQLFE